ncbi:MAG TPA: (Fe-S)-binding protein [Acidobacteriota bacterium]|nr:(Fe-S)-binding protein [bacterium]HNX19071.1 (Fe-S)-binding protein [Acidobacteriota bacterium]
MSSAETGLAREELDAALAALDAAADGPTARHLNACVRCGLCGQSCHVYLGEPDPRNLPVAKAEKVARLYRRRKTLLGRIAPRLVGADDLDARTLAALTEAVFGRCTGCGRCGLHCSIGLDVSAVIRAGRRVVQAAGRVPVGLQRTVDNQIQTGNQMAITRDEFLATCSWLSEDLAREAGTPEAKVRVDEQGARALYLVNPREVKFFPLSLQAAAGIFHAAGESWTMSSNVYDVTNYGFFAADDQAAGELARRVVQEAHRLGVSEIILSECGHGFRAFRWEGPAWLGAPYKLPVRSVLEVVDEYLADGRIKVDPALTTDRVTLHDPCNLVRWGGISEPQRRILKRACTDFVEMTPNHEHNFCCGGGGGMLSMEEYGERRVKSGRVKADQIRATGATVVACPCHNCADQLIELSRVYELGVDIKAVVEIVYDALVR